MVNVNSLMRAWLLTLPSVTALIGSGNLNGGIYAGPDLPEHFDPKLGPCLQVFLTPSTPHAEINPLIDARVQLRAWADVLKSLQARTLYGAVRDIIHGAAGVDMGANGYVIRCLEVTSGQDVTDPDTGWATVTAFFMVMAR